ncbi:hypothetical protein AB4K08_18280 [Serratia fonticola]|uniref:hypothetical protein n=1 Tax=Serratia fonticola TaxID=47917 RepID=UPI0034C65E56
MIGSEAGEEFPVKLDVWISFRLDVYFMQCSIITRCPAIGNPPAYEFFSGVITIGLDGVRSFGRSREIDGAGGGNLG